ncbi:hypothetical protein V5F01_10780 [Streptomyces sp. NRRL B-2790]
MDNLTFPARTPVTALSRHEDHMEVWAVASDGGIYLAWWDGTNWYEWRRLGSETFPVNAPIAALSRYEGHMEVFAVRPDGRLYGNWWGGENANWHGWYPIGTETFDPGTPIAALSRFDDHQEVFAVRPDGRLYGNWWGGENANWHGWYPIGTETFDPGTPIAALSRFDDHQEVFAVRPDGRLYGNWWGGENANWHGWYPIGTETFDPGTPIAALSRFDDHQEIWAVRPDGGIYGNWWGGENANWHSWYRLLSPHDKIDIRWRSWGAADGPFGQPIGPKEDTPGRNGVHQLFERGEITSSIDEDMVVSVFRLRNEACFEWSRPHFAHDYFGYDITYNDVPQGQAATQFRSHKRGRIRRWVRLQGFGDYGFTVKSCTSPLVGSDTCRGYTIPVRVQLGEATETPNPGGPPVNGLIAERWHELGAWAGPLGKPVADEVMSDTGRGQLFENGAIQTVPKFGPNMVVAAYQRFDSIEVDWGGANTPFNAFRVDVHLAGGYPIVQKYIWLQDTELARTGIGSGHLVLRDVVSVGGIGSYFFLIFPVETSSPVPDPSLFPPASPLTHETPPGATPAIKVEFRDPNVFLPHGFNAHIDVPALDGTPAGAYASHGHRVNAIARHFARRRPLVLLDQQEVTVGENETIQLIAHMQAASEDASFRTVGELPSRVLAHVFIRRLNRGHGQVGTDFDEGLLGSRKGNYDMALKGLMVVLYRYKHLLTEEEIEDLLITLVPTKLSGPLRLALHEYVFATENAPETENHILMIESTRYLVNQMLYERLGDQPFDNSTNGLTAWLLDHLQQFAKHDFLEFNSRVYQRMSLHALLNLHEFATDKNIRKAARIILDYSMVKFAVSSTRIRRISPFRRMKENTNNTTDHKDLFTDPQGDPLIAFFHCYVGPTDRDGKATPWYPDAHTFNAVIGGLSSYRPPPAAYILALEKWKEPGQHIFNHGKRPQLHEADEDADGGVEIYSRFPSFLLTAGGMWLNSGYGKDEFTKYKQVAIAQSTTLLITRAFDVTGRPELDLEFSDLIRFGRWPGERWCNNTAVHRGFACGADLEIPDKWLDLTGAAWEDGWIFLNLNADLRDYGPLGVYVACYRTAPDPDQATELNVVFNVFPKNFGLLYAVEADTIDPATHSPVPFEAFKSKVKDSNDFPDPLMWNEHYTFHTIDGPTYEFWLRPEANKWEPRIIKEDGVLLYPNGFGGLPLVSGPYLWSNGHEGLIAFHHPGCDQGPLDYDILMDYSNPQFPSYADNFTACPKPWADRAQALADFAVKLWKEQRHKEGNDALDESIAIYLRLVAVDPQKYLPLLGDKLLDALARHRADMGVEKAQSIGRLTVKVYEQLGGLRPADSQTPVDYTNLAAFTPNTFWYEPATGALCSALYFLAYAHREADDVSAGAAVMVQRVRLVERLTQTDPSTYQLLLGKCVVNQMVSDTKWRAALGPEAALFWAQRGVRVYEELAGLRTAGSTGPIDYENLSAFMPNTFWYEPATGALCSALYFLAYAHREADDVSAGAAVMVQRVRLVERLTQTDPSTYQLLLGKCVVNQMVSDTKWRAALGPEAALFWAQRGVRVYEELAGLRTAGSTGPIDYENLSAFMPNTFWYEPATGALCSALYFLAYAHREADDVSAGAAVMVQRVRLVERLTQTDPSTYQLLLGKCVVNQMVSDTKWRAALGPEAALFWAQRGVRVYEELAGLRTAGSTGPIDYENLSAFMPNTFWYEPATGALCSALYFLAYAHREADDVSAGAAVMVQRVRLVERLTQTDPSTYQPLLAQARADAVDFGV